MLQKTRAIVLHSLRYGDSSLIVHAYTEEWGRQSFLLKGVRKSKKSSRSNMYQALFILELDVYFRENREIQWIKEASFIDSAPSFYQDIVKSAQAIFLSEVLMKTVHEEEKNTALFHFLFHSAEYLESLEKASPSFHIIFLFQLSSYLGFYPRKNFSSTNLFFDVPSGSFTATPSTANIDLETILGNAWKKCFELDYSSADQVFMSQDRRNQFLDSLLHFYRVHNSSLGEIKSLEILRTVFGQ